MVAFSIGYHHQSMANPMETIRNGTRVVSIKDFVATIEDTRASAQAIIVSYSFPVTVSMKISFIVGKISSNPGIVYVWIKEVNNGTHCHPGASRRIIAEPPMISGSILSILKNSGFGAMTGSATLTLKRCFLCRCLTSRLHCPATPPLNG